MTVQDRRVRRTQRALGEALVSLILERGYERVTVQDILDRADVGRSTFYAHYRDKDALLMANFDGLREELRRDLDAITPGAAPSPASPVGALFDHAYRHRRVYTALCGRQGGSLVHRHLHRLVGDLLRDHLRPHLAGAGSDLPVDVVAEFAATAALGLLFWWIDHGFPHGPSGMANMYQRLTAPGIRAALGHHAEGGGGGELGLLFWWIDHGFPHGPSGMANMYQRLTAPGIRAALGHHAEGEAQAGGGVALR